MAIKIPLVVTADKDLNLFQTQLGKSLQPIISNPILDGTMLNGISLASGATTFPTNLNRTQQGWFLTDVNGAATIYRSQPFNDSTLTLTSNAAVTANIWVF